MKSVLLAFALLFGAADAFAQAGADNRETAINGTSLREFKTSKVCFGDPSGDYFWNGSTGNCPNNTACTKFFNNGLNATGTDRCCRESYICREDGSVMSSEEIQAMLEEEKALENIFAAYNEGREYFWGYHSSTNRSSNTGRTVSIDARLDACLHHSNWDPSGTYPSCLSACGDGSKNAYCTANSNDVCNDRCECKYSQAGCNNL